MQREQHFSGYAHAEKAAMPDIKVNWDGIQNDATREELYSPDGLAFKCAKHLHDAETGSSQLRNLLSAMESAKKRIKSEQDAKFEIRKVIPKLANMASKSGGAGKHNKAITTQFYQKFSDQLGKISSKKGFEEFLEFYKAIIQFHAFLSKLYAKRGESDVQ